MCGNCWLTVCLRIYTALWGSTWGRRGQEVAKGPWTHFQVYRVLLIDMVSIMWKTTRDQFLKVLSSAKLSMISPGLGTGGCPRYALWNFQRGPASPGVGKRWSREPNCGRQMFLETFPVFFLLWNRLLSSWARALGLGWVTCDALECQVRRLASLGDREPLLGLQWNRLSLSMWARALGWYPVAQHFHLHHVGVHSFLWPGGIFICR